jgi:hypothetical protein
MLCHPVCIAIVSEAKDQCTLPAAPKMQRSFAAKNAAQDDKWWDCFRWPQAPVETGDVRTTPGSNPSTPD